MDSGRPRTVRTLANMKKEVQITISPGHPFVTAKNKQEARHFTIISALNIEGKVVHVFKWVLI